MGGYLRWGTPWPGLMGGSQGGVPPVRVSPQLGLTGGVPEVGYPLARSDGGVPEVGYPLLGYPWPGLTGEGTRGGVCPVGVLPARSDGGTQGGVPPVRVPLPLPLGVDRQTDGWMDKHVSKHNLPSYYVRGR